MPQTIVMFSGGAASAVAGYRAMERYGREELTLLFCDTLMEDDDTYRFLDDAAAWIGVAVTRLCEGRTPWQVFRDRKFLGNTRADPCSFHLKRQIAQQWVKAHTTTNTRIVIGLDSCERHRIEAIAAHWAPRQVEFPLFWAPPMDKDACRSVLRKAGVREPRLYALGFAHNNCGGFCVKAGQAHFRHLLATLPERYAYHEAQEEALRQKLGGVAILRDRRGGRTQSLSLRNFRELCEQQGTDAGHQEELWGGCGCFTDTHDTPEEPTHESR